MEQTADRTGADQTGSKDIEPEASSSGARPQSDLEASSPASQDQVKPQRSLASGWAITFAIIVLLLLLYIVRYGLVPFILAGAIGFVTEPVVRWGERRTGHRWVVVVPFCILIYAAILGVFYWVGTLALRDISDAVSRLPQVIHRVFNEMIGPNGLDLFGMHITADMVTNQIFETARQFAGPGQVAGIAGMAGLGLFIIVLTFVLIPYLMMSGPRIVEGTICLLPPERRGSVRSVLPKVVPLLRRYIIGICLVVLYTASAAWIGFGPVFHLPYAVLLAIVVGLLELIPAIGPMASGALVALTALQERSVLTAGLLIGFAIALRLSIDNIVGPLVLGKAVRIHPVVIILGFVCGGILFGAIGLLLAVPVLSTFNLVLQQYYAEPIAPGGTAEPETVQVVLQSNRSAS
ncbi:MAG: AI-2E family transporter [Acetobacteraceae bacterium]|nr:AI-2E family transporter [Acetobacteraceae bacterium]MBV8591906.1 AI-2E family transporter [Acetobacteraceae bacterium]